MLSSPSQIMEWLEKIDKDLAAQRNTLSSAASNYFHKKRDYELALAHAYVESEGTQKEREAKALIAVEALPIYQGYVNAEATYYAATKVVGVLETRATICQSLLKVHAREAYSAQA